MTDDDQRATTRGSGGSETMSPSAAPKIIRWSPVGHMLRDLIAEPDAEVDDVDPHELTRFSRFVGGLTRPLVMLDELAGAAAAADEGDVHAQESLAFLLRNALVADAPTDLRETTPDACCEPCHESRSHDVSRGVLDAVDRAIEASDGRGAFVTTDRREDPDAQADPALYAAIDETAAAALLIRVARLAVAGALGSDLGPGAAMDVVMSLALDASFAAALVDAHHAGGSAATASLIRMIGMPAVQSWIAPTTMQTFMGGQMPGMPDMPGVPGVPGVPGFPGVPGIPGVPKGPGTLLDDWLATFLKRFKKPRKWDPDGWGPSYPWWWDHPNYIDPRTAKFLACLAASRRILRALEEQPPTPPAGGAVWSTGISGISITGPCAGETITIRGKGFGATQPANTVLLLPTLDGCRVVAPSSWSDTKITAVLPVRVASGPVGFGNKAYIDIYNAWVAKMNDLRPTAQRPDMLSRLPKALRALREVPAVVGDQQNHSRRGRNRVVHGEQYVVNGARQR